jgi:hypothetical protein
VLLGTLEERESKPGIEMGRRAVLRGIAVGLAIHASIVPSLMRPSRPRLTVASDQEQVPGPSTAPAPSISEIERELFVSRLSLWLADVSFEAVLTVADLGATEDAA